MHVLARSLVRVCMCFLFRCFYSFFYRIYFVVVQRKYSFRLYCFCKSDNLGTSWMGLPEITFLRSILSAYASIVFQIRERTPIGISLVRFASSFHSLFLGAQCCRCCRCRCRASFILSLTHPHQLIMLSHVEIQRYS